MDGRNKKSDTMSAPSPHANIVSDVIVRRGEIK